MRIIDTGTTNIKKIIFFFALHYVRRRPAFIKVTLRDLFLIPKQTSQLHYEDKPINTVYSEKHKKKKYSMS